jgi:hypothetical protein
MASMLQQSLGFLRSLSLSRRFLMKIDPERSKRRKRVRRNRHPLGYLDAEAQH